MVQQEFVNIKKYPRLFLRKNRFYIRVSIPRNLQSLAQRKELKYTLNCNSFYEALRKERTLSYKIDGFFNLLTELKMQIQENKLILNETEIKQVVKLYLKRIIKINEEAPDEFVEEEDIPYEEALPPQEYIFSQKNDCSVYPENMTGEEAISYIKNIISSKNNIKLDSRRTIDLTMQWIKELNEKPDTPESILRIIKKFNNIINQYGSEYVFDCENHTIQQEWMINLAELLFYCDIYHISTIRNMKKNTTFSTDNNLTLDNILSLITQQNKDISSLKDTLQKILQAQTKDNIGDYSKILSLIEAAKQERIDDLKQPIAGETRWTDLFEDFKEYKRINKKTDINTINQNYVCLDTIFKILGNKYLEELTYKDCQEISQLIHKLPKKWKEKYTETQMLNIIHQEHIPDNSISNLTVIKYLRAFREFLIFARKKRIITAPLSEDVEVPKKQKGATRPAFTPAELIKIFDKDNYPSKWHIHYSYRYWIPLIGLFSGMRLNEICQLYKEDIKKSASGKYYFHICKDRPDQYLKTASSARNIPIHPMLTELGISDLIKNTPKNKRLFPELTYTKENHYTNAISGWFNRYLDKLGIKQSQTKIKKDFHSFRHTVKPYLRDNGVSTEYCNALCGWEDNIGIGEKVYGGEIDVDILYNEICKLKYPFLNETLQKLK